MDRFEAGSAAAASEGLLPSDFTASNKGETKCFDECDAYAEAGIMAPSGLHYPNAKHDGGYSCDFQSRWCWEPQFGEKFSCKMHEEQNMKQSDTRPTTSQSLFQKRSRISVLNSDANEIESASVLDKVAFAWKLGVNEVERSIPFGKEIVVAWNLGVSEVRGMTTLDRAILVWELGANEIGNTFAVKTPLEFAQAPASA